MIKNNSPKNYLPLFFFLAFFFSAFNKINFLKAEVLQVISVLKNNKPLALNTNDSIPINWMAAYLPDTIPICNTSLPGAHDAGANGNGGAVYQCQYGEIADLLKQGIRFLDLRLQIKNGTIWIVHASKQQTKTLVEVLEQVKTFLIAQPTEFIILSFKRDASDIGDTPLQKALGVLLNTYEWHTYNTPLRQSTSVGEVRGKMVLLGRSGCSWLNQNFKGASVFGPWKDDTVFQTKLRNSEGDTMPVFVADEYKVPSFFSNNYEHKYNGAKDNILNAWNKPVKGAWHISFISGTGGLFSTPSKVAKKITPKILMLLEGFINDDKAKQRSELKNKFTGMIMGDFCTSSDFKKLTKHLININYYAFY